MALVRLTVPQEDLVRSIELAITSPYASSDLVHRLLNLAEFMEHEEKALPIENRTLGEYAMKFHAYAKALHYKELEFFTETSPTIIEALISINSKLQQHDAAWGTLLIAREQYDVSKHEEWYERLGRWTEALTTYEKKSHEDPDNLDVSVGRMRCLHALGEWKELAEQVEENWGNKLWEAVKRTQGRNEGQNEKPPLEEIDFDQKTLEIEIRLEYGDAGSEN